MSSPPQRSGPRPDRAYPFERAPRRGCRDRPPRAMSGASGPSTMPRPMEAMEASRTPGSSMGCVGGSCLQPFGGFVTAAPRQFGDGVGDRERRHGQHRQRPPRRNRREASVRSGGPCRPTAGCKWMSSSIAPRGQRDQDADDGGQGQEHAIVPGPAGVRWRRLASQPWARRCRPSVGTRPARTHSPPSLDGHAPGSS